MLLVKAFLDINVILLGVVNSGQWRNFLLGARLGIVVIVVKPIALILSLAK